MRILEFLPRLVAVGLVLAPVPAWAWGHAGHVKISELAMRHLPEDIPAFLRTPQAIRSIAELGAEADQSKTAGIVTGADAAGRLQTARNVHDAERDPGHFIDVDDAGFIQGGKIRLDALPPTREAYDTAQRAATDPAGQTQYTAGYLPYAMIDGFQQVRKDFGLWRALSAGLKTATAAEDRAFFAEMLVLREQFILRDIGYWSHFVADASQPMHLSVHYNGWGNFPNPQGYTNAPIHAPFEGAFVRSFVDFTAVEAAIGPYRDCACAIEQRVPRYLAETLAQLIPAYAATKASGDDNYRTALPAELAIVTRQLAAGAAELRDEIIDAWRQSTEISVGFPQVRVKDAEAGTIRITPNTFGAD